MENLMLDLALTAETHENVQAHGKQSREKYIPGRIEGVDELAAYAGKRPIQCFTMKMPFRLFLKFKRLIQKAKGRSCRRDQTFLEEFFTESPGRPFQPEPGC
jgi:hypothetical protein